MSPLFLELLAQLAEHDVLLEPRERFWVDVATKTLRFKPLTNCVLISTQTFSPAVHCLSDAGGIPNTIQLICGAIASGVFEIP